MSWSLADIRYTTRQVTGRFDESELSTTRLDKYINDYYVYTFPAEVKLEKKHTYYTFYSLPNVQIYAFPNTIYTNVVPPIRANGQLLEWYQDPGYFYQVYPEQPTQLQIGTGDAVTVVFNATLNSPPVLAGSVFITDNVELFTDDSNGNLTGSLGGTGTVVYLTGAVTLTFATAPASAQQILATYTAYIAGQPQAVLFYDNTFTIYPVPDTSYFFKLQAWKIVTALAAATDIPEFQEWGPAIAYGAALRIFIDNGEVERKQEVQALYDEQIDYILTRTVQNLSNTRAMPSF